MTKVEKLVRHHSPEQLEAQGEKVDWRIAKPEEMLGLLQKKLVEEVEELSEAIGANSLLQTIEELADVAQVVAALRHHLGAEDVDEKIREKFFDRGDFSHGVVMTIAPAVPMILHCPKCEEKHVDRGVFGTTHVHRSTCAKNAVTSGSRSTTRRWAWRTWRCTRWRDRAE